MIKILFNEIVVDNFFISKKDEIDQEIFMYIPIPTYKYHKIVPKINYFRKFLILI